MISNTINDRVNEVLQGFEFSSYVDTESGEIVGEGIFTSKDEVISQIKEQETRKQQLEYFKKKEERLSYVKALGNGQGFYFSKYVELLKRINNDYALALRFFYLCSFADYDGYLKIGKSFVNERDFNEIYSNLSENTIVKIRTQLIESRLISVYEDKIKVNDNYFLRNEITKDFKKECCRVFDYGIKQLYKELKPTEHKKIGKIIPLLEYMHYSNNILCSNPAEKDLSKIKPLSIKEIGQIIDINGDNYNRAVKYLLNVTVNDKPLLGEVRKLNSSVIVVNPTIFYKGSNIEDIKWLKDFFELDI